MAGAQVTALKDKIQAVADATAEVWTQVALGDPAGAQVSTPLGLKDRGQGWVSEKVVDSMFEGAGQYLEQTPIAKINEIIELLTNGSTGLIVHLNALIAQYNQLRADCITHGVSTTSLAVNTSSLTINKITV